MIGNRTSSGGGRRSIESQVGLLTGGGDRHYAFGLATALAEQGVRLDVIGSDQVDSAELRATPGVNFLSFRQVGNGRGGLTSKATRILSYYARLARYAASATPKVFHILWNNRFELIDRTLLMLYYKALGKKVVLTAHNVNAGARDERDTTINRLTLLAQYRLADHIFVHTRQMKRDLVQQFGVPESAVTIIPFGINNAVPETGLTPAQAKARLGIAAGDKTLLFFGNIAPYKGLDCLVDAFQRLADRGDYRLIIAGRVKKGHQRHWDEVTDAIERSGCTQRVMRKIEFIPDADIELYFKAADVLVLPYRHIFQSGVLFLGYSFGLPALVADVGSLKEDVVEGQTGLVFRPQDPVDLAKAIELYFATDLYKMLDSRRSQIKRHVAERHSWQAVGEITRRVYARLLDG